MARSKFFWLIVFETGKIQRFKAQTLWQIMTADELLEDSDSIVTVVKQGLADSDEYEDAIDIPFQD